MQFFRNNKKVSIIVIIFLSLFLLFEVTYAGYVRNIVDNYILETKGFYFNSSVLSINGKVHNINNWDGVNSYPITVDVNNKKNELISKNVIINALVSTEYTDSKPEEIKINKMPLNYEIKFTIGIQFARPDMLVLKYPCVIDNTLLPESLIVNPNKQESPMESIQGYYPQSSIDWYIDKTKVNYVDRTLIQFPYYDNWQVPGSSSIMKKSYHPWFISLFLMDEDKEKTILELGDILDEENEYEFHPILKEILKIQGNDSFRNDVLFNLSVFNNNNEVERSTLSMDDNLNISVPCIDLYKERRIVLSELKDIKKLNPKWYPLIEKYSGFLQLTLKDLEYIVYGTHPSLAGNVSGPNKDIWGYVNNNGSFNLNYKGAINGSRETCIIARK